MYRNIYQYQIHDPVQGGGLGTGAELHGCRRGDASASWRSEVTYDGIGGDWNIAMVIDR